MTNSRSFRTQLKMNVNMSSYGLSIKRFIQPAFKGFDNAPKPASNSRKAVHSGDTDSTNLKKSTKTEVEHRKLNVKKLLPVNHTNFNRLKSTETVVEHAELNVTEAPSPVNHKKLSKKQYYTRSKNTFRDRYNLLRNDSKVRFEVCNTFKYSPADWTLFELTDRYDPALENTTCNELYESLFKDEVLIYKKGRKKLKRPQKRVKWVVHTNQTITSLGCTKHTHECQPGAFYDHKRQMRIDTPPCCRQKMMSILEQVTDHLNSNNVSYTIVGGFVISHVRSKEILHYDDDIDVFIDQKHWKNGAFRKAITQISKKFRFHQNWRNYDKRALSLEFSKTNNNGLGMWDYVINSKKQFRVPTIAPIYNSSTMLPPQMVVLNNVKVKMPHKPVEYLDITFKQWKHEKDCKKKKLRKCI